ncbi:MAG: hypothetical protein MZW92_25445 [Comamonadaceae bacterium]|nr:hypothetical protein [Comamonadaceae bacterium]
MVFDERPSPARVSAAAAAELPRAVLLALIVAYIVSGLFGRDPWQEDDATGFGIMWSMAHGRRLAAAVDRRRAGRRPTGRWPSGSARAVDRAASAALVGDRRRGAPAVDRSGSSSPPEPSGTRRCAWPGASEAQPVAFAFGGEASARDYGRMLADVAVLLALGTIGPVVTAARDDQPNRPRLRLACLRASTDWRCRSSGRWPARSSPALALGLLVLTRGAQPALLAAWRPRRAGRLRGRRGRQAMRGDRADAARRDGRRRRMDARRGARARRSRERLSAGMDRRQRAGLRRADRRERSAGWRAALSWYAWPLWPLAAWALYAWRHGLRRPHIAIGGALVAAGLARPASRRACRT